MELSRKQQEVAVAFSLALIWALWLLNGFYMAALVKISVPLFWLVDIAQWVLLPGLLLFALARRFAILPHHYGYPWPIAGKRRLLLDAGLVFITGYLAYASARLFWALLGHPFAEFSWGQTFPPGWLGTLTWLYASLTAGLVESVFFISLPWLLYRSVLTRQDRRPNRDVFAVLVSLVFGLAHWEQGAHIAAAAFCFNTVMCAWFFQLRTLWPIAIAHIAIDLIVFA